MFLALYLCLCACYDDDLTSDWDELDSYAGVPNINCTESNRRFTCGDYLICNASGKCDACNLSDATPCGKHFYCRMNKFKGYPVCNYEPLQHPKDWDWRLLLGMILVFFGGIFVAGAGIGGGGLYVPILMMVVDFPASYCIPSSKALIFGGAASITLFNMFKRHPYYDRPLINYNVAAIIEPVSWLGTILGVLFNQIIPDWLLYSIQFILLSFTAWSTYKKARKDQLKRQEGGEAALITTGTYEGPAYSKWILFLLFVIWVLFLLTAFLRGGDGAESIIKVKFCSTWYWILTFGPFPIYALIDWGMIVIAKKYPVIGPNANMNFRHVMVLMASGFVAGIAAGFLGIGGGMIKGPMMLALDIEAEEMAATSSFMILLTSSATSIQYIAEGVMPPIEFTVYSLVGFVSSLIGIIFLRWLVRKLGNRAIFLYVLAALIFISAVLMSVVGIMDIINNVKSGMSNFNFRPFCRET